MVTSCIRILKLYLLTSSCQLFTKQWLNLSSQSPTSSYGGFHIVLWFEWSANSSHGGVGPLVGALNGLWGVFDHLPSRGRAMSMIFVRINMTEGHLCSCQCCLHSSLHRSIRWPHKGVTVCFLSQLWPRSKLWLHLPPYSPITKSPHSPITKSSPIGRLSSMILMVAPTPAQIAALRVQER